MEELLPLGPDNPAPELTPLIIQKILSYIPKNKAMFIDKETRHNVHLSINTLRVNPEYINLKLNRFINLKELYINVNSLTSIDVSGCILL